jgi:hypothetical protein
MERELRSREGKSSSSGTISESERDLAGGMGGSDDDEKGKAHGKAGGGGGVIPNFFKAKMHESDVEMGDIGEHHSSAPVFNPLTLVLCPKVACIENLISRCKRGPLPRFQMFAACMHPLCLEYPPPWAYLPPLAHSYSWGLGRFFGSQRPACRHHLDLSQGSRRRRK